MLIPTQSLPRILPCWIFSGAVPASQQFNFPETINIPASVISSGTTNVVYRRQFTDGVDPGFIVDFSITIGGGGADLLSASVTSTVANLTENQPAIFTANWQVNLDGGNPIAISSPGLTANGTSIAGNLNAGTINGAGNIVPEVISLSAAEVNAGLPIGP